MNIQIFGKTKCFDTKKAERYFKERNIKFQRIDILDKGLSKREFESVSNSVGGWENLIDEKSKAYDKLFIKYISDDDKLRKLMENPELMKTPIVRNKSMATVGYCPDIWKKWEENDK
jgi:arsenate reductase-like glutaredoxin family protein